MRHLLAAKDENLRSIGTRLVGHIFYHNIYIETLVNIIKTFTENKGSKSYLADAVETADVIIDLMTEYSALRPVIQQKKKRTSTKRASKKKKTDGEKDEEDKEDKEFIDDGDGV